MLLGTAKIEINAQTLACGMQNLPFGRFCAGRQGKPCHLGFLCGLGWIIERPAPRDKHSCAERQLFLCQVRAVGIPGSVERIGQEGIVTTLWSHADSQAGRITETKQRTLRRRKGQRKLQSLHLYDNVLICNNIEMNAPRTRASRVFTISFPEELAKQVVSVATEESRNLSELFREAFRAYQMERIQRRMLATRRITAERISLQCPENEIEPSAVKTRDESFS